MGHPSAQFAPAETRAFAAGRAPSELPWEWFNFTDAPRAAKTFSYELCPVETNAASWVAPFDGRLIPFKLLRATDAPRGPRPAVLFLHGMGLSICSFHGVAAWLLPHFDLLLVDYTGFSAPGGWPVGGASIPMLARAAVAAPAALGIDRFAVVGSSLGGGMALVAAIEHADRVAAIVLFNPACYPQTLPGFYRKVRVPILGELIMALLPARELATGAGAVGYRDQKKFAPRLREVYRANMRRRVSRLRMMDIIRALPGGPREKAPYLERSGNIRQPVQLIWGGQDRLLPEGTAARLKADLRHASPFVAVHCEELSHMPHEEAPERVGPEVLEFLLANFNG